MIITGASGNTVTVFEDEWNGQRVQFTHDGVVDGPPCHLRGKPHEFMVMHHYGEDGLHYCPTMFLYCPVCMSIGDEPEPYSCEKWGEA